jgi:hypothetical protein
MIIEKEDVYEVAANDLVVVTCRRDSWSLQLELQSSEAAWTLRIGGAFSLAKSTGDAPITATPSVTPLIGESVLVMRARKVDGALEARFSHDWVLTVEADPDYEAWEMYSSRGERLIAVPGNGVAKWGERK